MTRLRMDVQELYGTTLRGYGEGSFPTSKTKNPVFNTTSTALIEMQLFQAVLAMEWAQQSSGMQQDPQLQQLVEIQHHQQHITATPNDQQLLPTQYNQPVVQFSSCRSFSHQWVNSVSQQHQKLLISSQRRRKWDDTMLYKHWSKNSRQWIVKAIDKLLP